MDDGGRCLLDVINDPQLLQSFLENSNNNNSQQPEQSQPQQPSTDVNLNSTSLVSSSSLSSTSVSASSTLVANISSTTIPPTTNIATNNTSIILNSTNDLSTTSTLPIANTQSTPLISTKKTPPKTSKPKTSTVRSKKTNYVATKSSPIFVNKSSVPNPQPQQQQVQLQLNPGIMFQIGGAQGSPIQLNASNAKITGKTPAPTNTTFMPTQFQLGPRPMTLLQPQQFIIPNGLQVGQTGGTIPTQFVIPKPSPAPQNPTVPSIQPGQQIFQLIQTSQGTQIVQSANPSTTTNIQNLISTSTASPVTNKGTKGGLTKQILPKPNSKSKNTQNNKIINNVTTTNLINSPNIKLIQSPIATGSTGTFQTAHTNVQNNSTQFIQLGSNAPQITSPGIITGPNGTFLLNNIVPNIGSQPLLLQGNIPNQPLQLAIRPQTPLFVNSNTLAGNNETGNLNLSIANHSTSKSNVTGTTTFVLNASNPMVSQSGGLTMVAAPHSQSSVTSQPNIIIRSPLIGQNTPAQSVQSPASNQPPQLIQIQTANGPILLSLNPQASQQPAPAPPPPPPPPAPVPQTIQIGNTLISLAANTTGLNLTGSNNSQLSTLITPTPQHSLENLTIPQQPNIPVSSSFIITPNSQSSVPSLPPSNNNKSTTNYQPSSKTKSNTTGQQPASKSLNLGDLLKEAGILPDFSPPSSPQPTTPIPAQPNCKSNNNANFDTIQEQNTTINTPQSTVLMVPPGVNSATSNLLLSQNSNVLTNQQTQVAPAQQYRISLGPDGTLMFLPNNNPVATPNQLSSNLIVQSNNNQTNSSQNRTTKFYDASGWKSSQPSPDSTTPSIDVTTNLSGSPPTSLSSTTQIDSSQKNSLENTLESSLNEINSLSTSSSSITLPSLSSTLSTKSTVDTSSSIASHSNIADSSGTTTAFLTTNKQLPQATPSSTFTTILVPGSIIFTNENRSPICTINRSYLPELISLVETHVKKMVGVKQPSVQQKELRTELSQLFKNLVLIQTQQLPPNQIPQIRLSSCAQQILQLQLFQQKFPTITPALTTTQIIQKIPAQTQPSLVPESQKRPETEQQQQPQSSSSPSSLTLVTSSASTTAKIITTTTTVSVTTTTTTSSSTHSNTTTQSVQIVLTPKIETNSIQLVHSSPIINVVKSSTSLATDNSAKSTKTENTTNDNQKKLLINVVPAVPVEKEEPKSAVLKAIHSQLLADQNAALNPDCRTPFRSRDDACKRLLRYHVFDEETLSEESLKKFDELYEKLSSTLLYKKDQLSNKFTYLLLKEKTNSVLNEQVLINRLIVDDETESLKLDKEFVESGGDLPPVPFHWLYPESTSNFATETEETVGLKRKFECEDVYLPNSIYPTDIDMINTEEIYNKTASDGITFDDPFADATKTDTVDESISNILPEINDTSSKVNEIIRQFDNETTTLNTDEHDFMESLENVPSNKNSLFESVKNVADELNSTWSSQLSSQQQSLFEANNNTWTSQFNSVDETEADVAIQSIIDDSTAAKSIDDNNSIDFSLLKLDTLDNSAIEQFNNQEINEFAETIVNDNNKDIDKDKIDDSNNTTNITTDESMNFLEQNTTNVDDIENESANEIQMRSAIKSLMMSLSSNNVSTNQTSYYTQRNMDNENYLSNDIFSSQNFIQDNHHLNHSSSMLMNHHVSSSSLSGTTGSMMNTNAYIDTSTSMINDDPMLDEAVKSIL